MYLFLVIKHAILNPTIHVSCAVIINRQNEILAVQRSEKMSMPLKWEFPGGKIEKGESAEGALIREIQEELSILIDIEKAITVVCHSYDSFDINLYPYFASITSGKIILNEHKNMLWVKKAELFTLDWAEADLPIVKEVLERL